MKLDATPLRPQFAAKITGIDLGKRIDDELQRAIERAMDEYAVCVLPDQTLQDEQQVAFSRFYGPLEMSPGIGRKPGQAVPANGPGVMVYGPYAMFYIPKRGGYFFSTQPVTSRPFVQVGDVDRNKLKFTVDNEDFECISSVPILTQSDRGQIWVYHDRRYKPEGNWTKSNSKSADEFFTAASDTLNWWLP